MTMSLRPPRPGRRLEELLGSRQPEVVGAIVSLLVVVFALGGPLGTSATPGATVQPTVPAPSATAPASGPTPSVDAALVDLMTRVNDQIAAAGARVAELARIEPFPTADVASAIRELNTTARSALELVPQLERQPGAIPISDRLRSFYDTIRTSATAALRASMSNAPAYRQAAAGLATTLDSLPALQADLQALLLLPPPTGAPPTARPTPRATAGGSAPPPPTATPDGTPTGSPSAGPSLSPGGPELVANGAFDLGVGSPWALELESGVSANLAGDTGTFASGPVAARITIASPTTSRGAVALRQSGMPISAGASYLLRVSLKASGTREVLLRVVSVDGVTYGARVVIATGDWIVHELAFSAPIGDPSAIVSIELGRSTTTTWIDDVSLRETIEAVIP